MRIPAALLAAFAALSLVPAALAVDSSAGPAAPAAPRQGATFERAADIVALLQAAGYEEILIQELTVLRSWIPESFSPHYRVAEATLEIFEVESGAAAASAIATALETNPEDVPGDSAIWGRGRLVVILLAVTQHADVLAVLSDGLGGPDLFRPGEAIPLAERRDRPASDVIAAARIALREAAGGLIGGFVLAREAAVTWSDSCLGDAQEDELCAQALTDGWVLWFRRDADGFRVHTALLPNARVVDGPFAAARIEDDAVPTGGERRPVERNDPDATVSTSNPVISAAAEGDDDSTPDWVWAAIGAAIGAAILAGVGYRLWLGGRSADG